MTDSPPERKVFLAGAAGGTGGWTEDRLRRIPQYKQQFVEGLASELFPSEICQALEIGLGTIRKWRLEDKEFEDACSDAEAMVTDTLEKSAITRARDGILEPVVSGGKLVMDPEFPDRPLYTRRYSDSLLWNLLKSRRRERYGDKSELDLKGTIDVTGSRDSLRAKWAQTVATAQAVSDQKV